MISGELRQRGAGALHRLSSPWEAGRFYEMHFSCGEVTCPVHAGKQEEVPAVLSPTTPAHLGSSVPLSSVPASTRSVTAGATWTRKLSQSNWGKSHSFHPPLSLCRLHPTSFFCPVLSHLLLISATQAHPLICRGETVPDCSAAGKPEEGRPRCP